MLEPRLEHQTMKIRQLIDDYRSGKIVIPEFQREYVWKPGKAPKLIDSLYNKYPISSLLLWESNEAPRSRRKNPRPSTGFVSWLIDGQQRVITLARVLSGDEGIDVVFNPDEPEFRLANARTMRERIWFRVAELWDDDLYLQLRRNLDASSVAEKREKKFEEVRRILDYEVPLVKMVDHSFDNAVNAFTRINTLGVRLKREDIESAYVAAKHTGFIADEVVPFLFELKSKGFNRMNIMHLFRACAFIALPDGRNRTPLHKLDRNVINSAWNQTKKATDQAIGLLRSELGLVNMDVIWSGALIVPVIVLCAISKPRERDSRGIAAWVALAALLHRYSRSSDSYLDQDLKACRKSDPIGALLSNLRQIRAVLEANPLDFSGSLLDKSGLLAMYIACLNRGILDFYTESKLLLQSNINRHHILPRAQFIPDERDMSDCIANIAFISDDINKSIGQSGPEVYLKQLKTKVLDSQCIPKDENLWQIERAEDFWQERRLLLADSFNEFVRNALPQRKL